MTVTTEDVDVNSQILQFTVTDQLDILGTDSINSLQLTITNNPLKVHMDNIYSHYPEPPTSPGVMSTDLQGVPRPVDVWVWMPNSLLDNHDTQHADNNNNLLSIPFSDNKPGLKDISSSLLAESILLNPLVCNLASCIHSFNYLFTIVISIIEITILNKYVYVINM